jgi:hypothetical protein
MLALHSRSFNMASTLGVIAPLTSSNCRYRDTAGPREHETLGCVCVVYDDAAVAYMTRRGPSVLRGGHRFLIAV